MARTLPFTLTLLSTIMLAISAIAQDGAAPRPPVWPNKDDMKFGYEQPSNEMDFNVQPVEPPSFEDNASDNAAAPITPPPVPSQPGETIDQFFSTGTILPPEPQSPQETAKPVVEDKKPTPKKSPRRQVAKRNYDTMKKKDPFQFRSVRLPEPIYSKVYSRDNKHLPVKMDEADLQSLFALAVMEGRLIDMRALAQRGADIYEPIPDGGNFLVLAARYDQPDAVRWLLQNGVKTDTADSNGFTPLHYAASKNNHVIANLLLRFGANPNATDGYGATPLRAAESHGAQSTASVLRSFGAS